MDPDMSSFLYIRVLILCRPCAPRQQVLCSPSRLLPGAHRVVGPDNHLSSGPRMSVRHQLSMVIMSMKKGTCN
jgi:hypothetical protein